MTFRLHYILFLLSALPSFCFAQGGKLHFTRYVAPSRDVGRIRRIDFPLGFSVEYTFDASGRTSQKKLIGFKGINHPDCAVGQPCTVVVKKTDPLFSSAVSDEVLHLKYKSIPTLTNLIFGMSNNNPSQGVHYMEQIWKVIAQGQLQLKPLPDQMTPQQFQIKIKQEYLESFKNLQATLNATKDPYDKVEAIYSDLLPRLESVQHFYNSNPAVPASSLNATEKKLFEKNFANIRLCAPQIGAELSTMMTNNQIMRRRTTNNTIMEFVRSHYDDGSITIKIIGKAFSVALDKDLRIMIDDETADTLIKEIVRITQQTMLAKVEDQTYAKAPNVIEISDRFMMNYPNHMLQLFFTDPLFLNQYLGDATFNAVIEMGGYPYASEIAFAHEYMHTQQNKYWFPVMEKEKRIMLASLALVVNIGQGQITIEKEISEKIESGLIQPFKDFTELSATYNALDNLTCLR